MPEKTFFRKALALSVLAFLRKNLWDTCDEVSPHLTFHANGQWANVTCSEAIVAPHKYPFVWLSLASVASRFSEPRRRARRYMVAGGGAATAAQPPVSRKNKQNPAVWRGGIMCGFNLLRCFIYRPLPRYHPVRGSSVTAVFNGVPIIMYYERRFRSASSLHHRLRVLSP